MYRAAHVARRNYRCCRRRCCCRCRCLSAGEKFLICFAFFRLQLVQQIFFRFTCTWLLCAALFFCSYTRSLSISHSFTLSYGRYGAFQSIFSSLSAHVFLCMWASTMVLITFKKLFLAYSIISVVQMFFHRVSRNPIRFTTNFFSLLFCFVSISISLSLFPTYPCH